MVRFAGKSVRKDIARLILKFGLNCGEKLALGHLKLLHCAEELIPFIFESANIFRKLTALLTNGRILK